MQTRPTAAKMGLSPCTLLTKSIAAALHDASSACRAVDSHARLRFGNHPTGMMQQMVGWVERSEPHPFIDNSWWGSLRSTHPT